MKYVFTGIFLVLFVYLFVAIVLVAVLNFTANLAYDWYVKPHQTKVQELYVPTNNLQNSH